MPDSDYRNNLDRNGRLQDRQIKAIVEAYLREYLDVRLPPGHYSSYVWDGKRITGGLKGGDCIAIYNFSTNVTRANGYFGRQNFDTKIKDDVNCVTIGASWHFTPPSDGAYTFILSNICVPSAAFSAGEKLYWQLWPNSGGTLITDFIYQQIGITETTQRDQVLLLGVKSRYCLTTDTINFRFGNGTANSITLQGDTTMEYSTTISILRG